MLQNIHNTQNILRRIALSTAAAVTSSNASSLSSYTSNYYSNSNCNSSSRSLTQSGPAVSVARACVSSKYITRPYYTRPVAKQAPYQSLSLSLSQSQPQSRVSPWKMNMNMSMDMSPLPLYHQRTFSTKINHNHNHNHNHDQTSRNYNHQHGNHRSKSKSTSGTRSAWSRTGRWTWTRSMSLMAAAAATFATASVSLASASASTSTSTSAAATVSSSDLDIPIIPRADIFGNPAFVNPTLSADGQYLAFAKPTGDGILNVHVCKMPDDWSDDSAIQAALESAVAITKDKRRGIRQHVCHGKHVLYVQDEGGDENWHLYAVPIPSLDSESDTDGKEGVPRMIVRDLTPFTGVRAQNFITHHKHPDKLLVGLNLDNEAVFDMFRVDLSTGAIELAAKNPGDVLSWYADESLELRACVAMNSTDGSKVIRTKTSDGSGSGTWKQMAVFPHEENVNVVGVKPDSDMLFVESSLGSDKTRLVVMHMHTDTHTDTELGQDNNIVVTELASDEKCDVSKVLTHHGEVQGVVFEHMKPTFKAIDANCGADLQYLHDVYSAPEADASLSVMSQSDDGNRWVLSLVTENRSPRFVVFDRTTKATSVLSAACPALDKHKISTRKPVSFKVRDGVEIVGYLTKPLVKRPDNSPPPMVLYVHGGPWARDSWGYDAVANWLSNRGYTTLQVNYRGSTGFGKRFLNLGDGEWGVGSMQHDLTDSVKWAIENGHADGKRIAIFGGSYGGYACLAGLTFTPDLYCCGVDIVGPSHIRTLFQSIPAYWKPLLRTLELRIGDVLKDEDLNRRISPLFHVDKITKPLLIGQGANDPRVKIAESDQIVDAMRDRNIPVDYIVYPDEGHGFAVPENRLDFFARAEAFLAQHLQDQESLGGGRVEPYNDADTQGHSAEQR
jgi:dipeptidyl aminopeptidase/acylaminoacyl peptidase